MNTYSVIKSQCHVSLTDKMDSLTLPEDKIKCPLDEEIARELLEIVRARIATRAGYAKLAGLSFFFSIYFFTILMQINVEDSYEVESRCGNIVHNQMSIGKIKSSFVSYYNLSQYDCQNVLLDFAICL